MWPFDAIQERRSIEQEHPLVELAREENFTLLDIRNHPAVPDWVFKVYTPPTLAMQAHVNETVHHD